MIFYFSKPYRLRAQNSFNRSGYGDYWDWSDPENPTHYKGKKYGETTDYAFAGAYIDEKSLDPLRKNSKNIFSDDLVYLSDFKTICKTVGGLYDHEIKELEKKLKNEIGMQKENDKWIISRADAYGLFTSNPVAQKRCENYACKSWDDVEKRYIRMR